MTILPILATSLIHFSLKGWENVLFELGSERDKQYITVKPNQRTDTCTHGVSKPLAPDLNSGEDES